MVSSLLIHSLVLSNVLLKWSIEELLIFGYFLMAYTERLLFITDFVPNILHMLA